MMKLFSVILCILCMLCTTASATESSSNSEYVFHCSAGSTVMIDSRIFDEAVTVHGDPNASADTPGQLMFTNCIFNAGITFLGNGGDVIIFADDCKFANNTPVIMAGEEKEATIETSLPRIITCVPINYFSLVRGTLVASNVDEITVNGETMRMADCTNAIDPNTGETLAYDDSIDYNCFLVSQWWENGEKIDFVAVAIE